MIKKLTLFLIIVGIIAGSIDRTMSDFKNLFLGGESDSEMIPESESYFGGDFQVVEKNKRHGILPVIAASAAAVLMLVICVELAISIIGTKGAPKLTLTELFEASQEDLMSQWEENERLVAEHRAAVKRLGAKKWRLLDDREAEKNRLLDDMESLWKKEKSLRAAMESLGAAMESLGAAKESLGAAKFILQKKALSTIGHEPHRDRKDDTAVYGLTSSRHRMCPHTHVPTRSSIHLPLHRRVGSASDASRARSLSSGDSECQRDRCQRCRARRQFNLFFSSIRSFLLTKGRNTLPMGTSCAREPPSKQN